MDTKRLAEIEARAKAGEHRMCRACNERLLDVVGYVRELETEVGRLRALAVEQRLEGIKDGVFMAEQDG